MTTHFILQHELDTPVERFWTDIFESEDFNRALYIDHLGYRYELDLWDRATGHRRARVWPTHNVPKALASVLGNTISFVEDGIYDEDAERYDFKVIPSTLAGRIGVSGTVEVEPLSARSCERSVTFEIEARVFGVGHLIESFLETTTREQYDRNALFINEYLATTPGRSAQAPLSPA